MTIKEALANLEDKALYYRMMIEANMIDTKLQPTLRFSNRGLKCIDGEIYVTEETLPYILFRLFKKYGVLMKIDVEMGEDVIEYLKTTN